MTPDDQSHHWSMFDDYLAFVKGMTPDEIDRVGNDWTACWLFAYYYHTKHGLPIVDGECVYPNTCDWNDLVLSEGTYSFLLSHDEEFHHFILKVSDRVTLLSTYGGQQEFIKKKYTKEGFVNLLKKACNGDPRVYSKLFGTDSLLGSITGVTLEYYYTPQ